MKLGSNTFVYGVAPKKVLDLNGKDFVQTDATIEESNQLEKQTLSIISNDPTMVAANVRV